MDWAKANQASMVFDGLGMLVEQAAAAFKFWTDKQPETQLVIKTIRALGRRSFSPNQSHRFYQIWQNL
jgi:shikimate 5-dehydrogenase